MKRQTNNVKALVSISLIGLIVCCLSSCSTEKAKWVNVQYHNTTCHYNVWWNGNESLKLGKEKLHKAVVDDYTQFLPPEPLGTQENAQSVNPEMDRAVEKGVKGIKKHSIFVKGEEHVPYIKECYLLTAYATFYKQDYISTANTCNILVSQFSGTPAGDQGAVLLARCLTREGRYADAEAALDQLATNLGKGNFARSQRTKLYVAMIEATLPQQKYKKTVEYINLAVESSRDNDEKARLTFLLAQIYQHLDKRPVAAKYYHKVLSYRPEYVMEFNARLGEASCADLSHSDLPRLERQLDDMLRDKKNTEYRDQIYFAKGEMYLGAKDAQKACDNYRRSVAVSTSNKAQKTKSALRMGEVLYEMYENYDLAQRYYDTAMQNIAANHPDYHTAKRRNDILTELIAYTSVYHRNDSLLAVASLSEEERLKLINATIDTLRRREQEAKERELLAELMADAGKQQNTLSGDWYFYNQQTVQKGKEAFRQRWGLRPLEDLWFLSSKPTFTIFDDDTPEEQADSLAATNQDTLTADSASRQQSRYGNPDDPHAVAYYLKDLPTTPQQLDSIDSLTAAALLGAAYIFYDDIKNTPQALQCYLRLAKDYTSFDNIVQAFYMLYRIYDAQGNTPQANYYRDMVLMGFPDSDFANLIRDNEYYRQLIARHQRIEEDYQNQYELFQRRRYQSVISLADQAAELYPAHPMLGKFEYWKALALAKRGDRQPALGTLQGIVAATAESDTLHTLALTQLELLQSDPSMLASSTDETITTQDEQRAQSRKERPATANPSASSATEAPLPPEALIYRYRENQQYYIAIIVNDRTVKATELQYKLADFNSQYYANSGYKANAVLFTDTTQLITVHRFITVDEAAGYYRHLLSQDSPIAQLAASDYSLFFISTQNYATFYNRKNIAAYMAFFRKYLLKNNK